eukprot:jgi/Ulvmu1/1894/UM012_0052.1
MRVLLRGCVHGGRPQPGLWLGVNISALPGASVKAPKSINAMAANIRASSIGDAHCHAQLDPKAQQLLGMCQSPRMALMGVSSQDWPDLQLLAESFPDKVQPCFGIHPWKAHLHTSNACSGTVASTIDASSAEAPDLPVLCKTPLITGWREEMLALLRKWPRAIVGEIGIDRAARVPGTKCITSYSHQWSLFEDQMAIAAEHRRPVSLHCVQAYGHLRDHLRSLNPADAPPRIMLHSYGGSPEMVREFTSIGGGGAGSVGGRIFFSFSAVLCRRSVKKAAARIRAVPAARLLLESDLTEVAPIDAALADIVAVVCAATGEDEEAVVQQAARNFEAFYEPPYDVI